MKKNELKAVLKPIVEEILKDSLLENGFLGKLITEVFQAANNTKIPLVSEQKQTSNQLKVPSTQQKTKRIPERLKSLENAGYFDGIKLPEVQSMVNENKTGVVVEGVGLVKTQMDDFLSRPGIDEDTILKLMGKK